MKNKGVDYMSATLYAKICPTPYQKITDPGNNTVYPIEIETTQVVRKSV